MNFFSNDIKFADFVLTIDDFINIDSLSIIETILDIIEINSYYFIVTHNGKPLTKNGVPLEPILYTVGDYITVKIETPDMDNTTALILKITNVEDHINFAKNMTSHIVFLENMVHTSNLVKEIYFDKSLHFNGSIIPSE